MAQVNEAYRVLSDPGRRLTYDRSIGARGSAAPPSPSVETSVDVPPVPPSRLIPDGPAKVPWKMMGVAAVIGSVVILVGAAFNDPPSVEPPDGILRVGSCVRIEPNLDVREIACTGEDDIIVELVIPTDARCPTNLAGYRDRLGLGIACIDES